MKVKIFVAFVLTISLLAPLAAQQQQKQQEPQKQDDVVRTVTNLVQIDVVVTDKAGRQVTDLTPEDFEVSEDGKKRQVTHFSYIAAESVTASQPEPAPKSKESKKTAAPVKPIQLTREQVRRTVALVIDDLGLSYESFGSARKALLKFVDEQMQPNDMVAILRTSAGIGTLQQFTSDKRQLHAAIERVRWNPMGRGGLDPRGTMNQASVNSDVEATNQYMKEAEDRRAGLYSVGTMGTMNAIVRGMGEMPGRKSIVLIGEAFELFDQEGRNQQLVIALQRLTDEANANSVTIYTVDASGLQTNAFTASDKVAGYSYVIDPKLLGGPNVSGGPRTLQRVNTQGAPIGGDVNVPFRRLGALSTMRSDQAGEAHTVLSYLAQRTGGFFQTNRNDLGASIQRIMQDQQGYYLIGFRPDESTIAKDGTRRLHSLKVKVKRSGTKVRSRAGYLGVSDESREQRPRTRAEQLKAALTTPFASGGINIQLTSLFGDEPKGGGTYMRSLLHIDAKDLEFKTAADGTRTAELDLVAVAFGDNGQVVEQLNDQQTVSVANDAVYQQLLDNGLVYILNVPVKKGGPYQMRVAVRDATSQSLGSAMQFVQAPDLANNRPALSGIVLSGAVEGDKASVAEQDIRSGPAIRQFRQGMMLDYRFLIYNAQAAVTEPVQMQMRLLREGKEVFTGKVVSLDMSKEANPKRVSTGGRLRLGPDLTFGNYILQVTVKKKSRVASQWIDFEIVN